MLCAGDAFVTPELFIEALTLRVGDALPLRFQKYLMPWPYEPFGTVGTVHEASGTVGDLVEAIGDATVALTQLGPFTQEVFDACPKIRFIGVCRGGPVNIDLRAATAAGVMVTYAPARNAQAAAEFTIGHMIAAMRRIASAHTELAVGTWRGDYYSLGNAGLELAGETVGLVGYGAIGRIVSRVLRAFGAVVLTFDPYADPAEIEQDGVELVELDDLLRRSAVVSLHARLTTETHHLLNASNLGLLRPGAILVNCARGGLLDYEPLPAMLEDGRLGALALDVYDIEPPPPDWPLFGSPNLVLSPHLAGATRQTAERAAQIVADDAARFLQGQTPRFVANPAVLEQLQQRGSV